MLKIREFNYQFFGCPICESGISHTCCKHCIFSSSCHFYGILKQRLIYSFSLLLLKEFQKLISEISTYELLTCERQKYSIYKNSKKLTISQNVKQKKTFFKFLIFCYPLLYQFYTRETIRGDRQLDPEQITQFFLVRVYLFFFYTKQHKKRTFNFLPLSHQFYTFETICEDNQTQNTTHNFFQRVVFFFIFSNLTLNILIACINSNFHKTSEKK